MNCLKHVLSNSIKALKMSYTPNSRFVNILSIPFYFYLFRSLSREQSFVEPGLWPIVLTWFVEWIVWNILYGVVMMFVRLLPAHYRYLQASYYLHRLGSEFRKWNSSISNPICPSLTSGTRILQTVHNASPTNRSHV